MTLAAELISKGYVFIKLKDCPGDKIFRYKNLYCMKFFKDAQGVLIIDSAEECSFGRTFLITDNNANQIVALQSSSIIIKFPNQN